MSPKKEPEFDQSIERPHAERFEELVEAALKVDPKGLSGKHKNKPTPKARKAKKR